MRLEITSKAILDIIARLPAVKPVVMQDSKHGEDSTREVSHDRSLQIPEKC